MTYQFKTDPFNHQREVFEDTKDLKSFAVLWEQGTGKTKVTIDTIGHLYTEGKIDALLVVAPGGVELNWLTDELPTHMPDSILRDARLFHYRSPKSKTKWHQKALASTIYHEGGLAVMAMSYDAFMTKDGKNAAWKFLQKRRVFYTIDEGHAIKTPGAKRTKSIVASSKYASYRRLLTGTPVAQGPFDIYSQLRFLDERFWHEHGFRTFAEFKQYFGIFEDEKIWTRGKNGPEERTIQNLVSYQNIDELYKILASVSSRVVKDDVLDLPPKLYKKRYFDMTPEQTRAYEELTSEYMTEIVTEDAEPCEVCGGSGLYSMELMGDTISVDCEACHGTGQRHEIVEAPLAIVRLLRLQQITCGYLPTGDELKLTPLGSKNPRLDALEDTVAPLGGKSIIWSRFTNDIDLIMERLESMGRRPVRYDGQITDEECARSKEEFQKGDATDFVGNPAKGKEGLTLHAASTMIYYNNSFKLIDRLQSEDRAHRIGQKNPVTYVDICAPGTIDIRVTDALRSKLNIASQITGDRIKEWL